ncbi:MAG: hypothetical protein JSW00_14040 [Thermoplasmata archaeon]|nr:MAG: hypothetical protein JSW00_14040 [Thermoplasmata archaeon]
MIKGSECLCGKKVVPKRDICPKCGKHMSEAEFQDFGRVLTLTILHVPPEGYEGPIMFCMVAIEGGAKLVCGYEGDRDLDIGEHVRIKKIDNKYICEPLV